MKNDSQSAPSKKPTPHADNRMRIEFDRTQNSTKLFNVSKEKHTFSLEAHEFTTREPPYAYSNIHGYIRHVFPSADISCTAGEESIGVDIIVKKKIANTFSFLLSSPTLGIKRMESDHRILLYDADLQMPVFAIVDPIALDGKNNIAPPVFCNIEWSDTRQVQFTYCLDRDWLESTERSFPVTLHAQIVLVKAFHTIVAQFEDFSADDLSFHTGLRHYYAPHLDINDGVKESLGLKMNLGKGWRLNLLQSIKSVVQNFKVAAFHYRDEENVQTLLFKSDEEVDKNDRAPGSDADDNYAGCCCCCDMEYYNNYDSEHEGRYYDSDAEPPKLYYYKSKDGLLKYNPETRVLQKGNDRLVFDMNGRLIQIVDSDNHSLSIIYRDGQIVQLFGGLRHSFHFAYSQDNYLKAIIGSCNQWIQYDYAKGSLREVHFSTGQKYVFSTPSGPDTELTMRMQKDFAM